MPASNRSSWRVSLRCLLDWGRSCVFSIQRPQLLHWRFVSEALVGSTTGAGEEHPVEDCAIVPCIFPRSIFRAFPHSPRSFLGGQQLFEGFKQQKGLVINIVNQNGKDRSYLVPDGDHDLDIHVQQLPKKGSVGAKHLHGLKVNDRIIPSYRPSVLDCGVQFLPRGRAITTLRHTSCEVDPRKSSASGLPRQILSCYTVCMSGLRTQLVVAEQAQRCMHGEPASLFFNVRMSSMCNFLNVPNGESRKGASNVVESERGAGSPLRETAIEHPPHTTA